MKKFFLTSVVYLLFCIARAETHSLEIYQDPQAQAYYQKKSGFFRLSSPDKIPEDLKILKVNTFDWDNYLSILGMIKTIRKSTDQNYILPTQAKCNKLIVLVRKYLEENNALID
jgi:hypothetical protein